MNNCKILLIDSPSEINLIKESLTCTPLAFELICCSSIPESMLAIVEAHPDLIMIGSGMLIRHGFKIFQHINGIPTAVLCEGVGFEIMFQESCNDILFLSRPFGLEGIEEVFQKALEFVSSQKEK